MDHAVVAHFQQVLHDWMDSWLKSFVHQRIIRASSCLRVLCSWKILWTVKEHCINLGSYGKYVLRVQRLVGTPTWSVAAFPYSGTLSALCSLHWTKQQTALALNWKWPFPCKLNTQESMVVLLTTPTNSANKLIAEQADQLEFRIKAGLFMQLAAFTAYYQKGVHIGLPIRKEQHCLTAQLCCQASKGVTTQRRRDTLLGTATLPST